MKTFLSVLWHLPFFGFLFAIYYAILGVIFCISIVGAPIGLGLLQFSKFLLSPFKNKMVNKADVNELSDAEENKLWKAFSLIVRIVYFPFGCFGAISCCFVIAAQFITIIGIPAGMVWAKSLGTIFNPVSKVCVPNVVAEEIERKKQEALLNKYSNK
jgi:Predicted membrane protein